MSAAAVEGTREINRLEDFVVRAGGVRRHRLLLMGASRRRRQRYRPRGRPAGEGRVQYRRRRACPGREWLPYLAACADAKRPRRLPRWLARPLAGDMVVGMMTAGRGFSNAKAERELGWELRYPSWRQGFKGELARPGLAARAY